MQKTNLKPRIYTSLILSYLFYRPSASDRLFHHIFLKILNHIVGISLENVKDFANLLGMVASKVISTDNKHFQSWQCSRKYCRNWCHFHVFVIISGQIAWLEDSETETQKSSTKSFFKKLCKIYRKTSASGLFFNKVPGWKPAILSNRDFGTGVFL